MFERFSARRPNQSILKEISPGGSLEGLMKLKLQYFDHLMWRADSLEKTLMLGGMGEGGEGDNRGWDGWTASLTRWMWVWVNSGSWWWTGRPGVLRFMGSQRVGHDWATELHWTEAPQSPAGFLERLAAFLGCSFALPALTTVHPLSMHGWDLLRLFSDVSFFSSHLSVILSLVYILFFSPNMWEES